MKKKILALLAIMVFFWSFAYAERVSVLPGAGTGATPAPTKSYSVMTAEEIAIYEAAVADGTIKQQSLMDHLFGIDLNFRDLFSWSETVDTEAEAKALYNLAGSEELATLEGEVDLNTAKTGITAGQASAIIANTAKQESTITADTTTPTKAAVSVVSESVTPVKTSGVPGINYLYTANGTDIFGTGFVGPDTATDNTLYKYPSTKPTAGQQMAFSAPVTTTIDGASYEVVTITWVANGSGGSSDPDDLNGDTVDNDLVDAAIIDSAIARDTEVAAAIAGVTVGSPVTTYPTYSDDACTKGQYAYGTSPAPKMECKATNEWDYLVVSGSALVWAGWDNPAPVAYSLTLAVVGGSTLTIDSTGYTSSGSPHTITGLSGATDMDVTYSGSEDTTVFTGTDSGDVTGSTPNFDIDMDEAKSLICTFSGSTTGLLAALDCYQDNGEALDTGGVNVTAVNIAHGNSGASVIINDNADVYSFPCNETNGLLDPALGTVKFDYTHLGDVSSGVLFSQSTGISAFRAYRYALADQIYFAINGDNAAWDVPSSLWDGNTYSLTFTYNHATGTRVLYIGATEYTDGAAQPNNWTDAAITAGDMHIGKRGDGLFASNAEFQNFKIYSTIEVP